MKTIKCQNCGEEYTTAGMSEQVMQNCPECRGREEKYDQSLISLQE